jgi:general secretion pathway protein D
MKKISFVRFATSLMLCVSLLSSPAFLLAGEREAKKHFKEGMKYSYEENWEKAVEAFALAVTENPRNSEYKAHYIRAMFNASQICMKKGNSLAEQKDYEGAYNNYRKAYAYDNTNELAKALMEKMLRLRQEDDSKDKENKNTSPNDPKLTKVSFNTQKDDVFPQRIEKLRDVIYQNPVDLQWLIKELAKDLDLNVIFDKDTFRQESKVKVEYRNVTSAKALDYLFLQEGLFFQKVGPRTVVVANQNQRQKFQQLVLKTFYLSNASPKDIAKIIPTAIPIQPGRTQTTVLQDEATNSVTVRDTEENIRLIGKLIRSLDKDRAEVVMDVNIYEVTKNDLLKLGNQVGDDKSLINLGGVTGRQLLAGVTETVVNPLPFRSFEKFGLAVGLPTSNIQALQSKGNSKLLASTQVHAFNNEESTARIGQRVPVRTASLLNFSGNNNNNNNNNGNGAEVINYEQVGLTLKFTPIVFPNQDVQVKMEIESKDVAGAASLTPTFTERSIKGTARIQNNKTLLLASVAQDNQSNSKSGLPLLGLVPILGRLFTAPSKENRQTDIVIAVTPKVLRAPTILPEDEIERNTGSVAVPTSGSLEAMIVQEEREEYLASQRRLTNNVAVQLPDQNAETPKYVAATNVSQNKVENKTEPKIDNTTESKVENNIEPKISNPEVKIKPIDSGNVRTLQIAPTADSTEEKVTLQKTSLPTEINDTNSAKPNMQNAELQIFPDMRAMKAGEKMQVSIIVNSNASMTSAILALHFDSKKLAVRNIIYGDMFGTNLANKQAKPFINSNGKMYVTLSGEKEISVGGSDVLAFIEIESLVDGTPEIKFNTELTNILSENGGNFLVKYR